MHKIPQARNSQVGYSHVRKLADTQTRKHKNLQVEKLVQVGGMPKSGRSCVTYKSQVISKAAISERLENEWIVVVENEGRS